MNELDNNNNTEVKKSRKAFGVETPELTWLEASIQSRRNDLNEAALCAMFELTHEQLTEILSKLPPVEDCNC